MGARDQAFDYHVNILYFVWTFADLPILIGRYGKGFKYGKEIHGLFMAAASVATLITVTMQAVNVQTKALGPGEQPTCVGMRAHCNGALALFILILVQGASGTLLESIVNVKNSKLSNVIPYARRIHLVLGLAIYGVAKYQLYGQSSGFTPFRKVMFFGVLGLSVITVALFETLHILKGRNNTTKRVKAKASTLTETQKSIVRRIKGGASSSELKAEFPDKYVFVYKNLIYDLSDYNHPGGDIIFRKHNFKEVSRYLSGIHKDESLGVSNHVHSSVAYSVMDSRLIGNVIEDDDRLVDRNGEGDNWTLFETEQSKKVFSTEQWVLESKEELSRNLFIARFRNEGFNVKTLLKGVNWLGKHFYITNDNKRRPYTSVISLSESAIAQRHQIIEKYGKSTRGDGETNNNGNTNGKDQFKTFSDSLSFGIKPYPAEKALSKEIGDAAIGARYTIEGPFGVGLDLPRNFSGSCAVFGLGTGFLPYLDLFDFLLKKTAYSAWKKVGKDQYLDTIQPVQDYEKLFPGASFKFFGAFQSVEDFVGHEWISEIHRISREAELGIFEAKIRLNQRVEIGLPLVDQRFNKDFLKQNIIDAEKEVEKVIICGTNEAMKSIFDDLVKLGYPEGRIHFV